MKKSLLQLLLDKNLVTQQVYKEVKKLSLNRNCSEEQIILQGIKVDINQLIEVLDKCFNIPYIDLESDCKKNLAFKLIPKEVANRYSLIPFFAVDNEVHVAFSNPFEIKVIDELMFITNKKVKIFYAMPRSIFAAIENCYGKQIVDVAVEEMRKGYILEADEKSEDLKAVGSDETAPVIRITNSLLKQAVNAGASDIHLEPFQYFTIVRMRVDGNLNEITQVPCKVYKSICTRIKIMAKMDIATKLVPQDGKITEEIEEISYDFRVSSLPTMFGEKLVLRVLYKSERFINLDSLGFSTDKVMILRDILKLSHGMIVVTGPTGSGKSTTLYALLNEINSKNKNIITIEDPIEYDMPRINQVNVNSKAGLTFSTGLRSILRQDPDVIMLGEIRDEETAQIAVRASITGHLVLSTLHTNNAVTTISRLIDMGIPSYLVADSLVVVLSQRLVRKLCAYCKVEYEDISEGYQHLEVFKGKKIFKALGCSKCSGTGYKGRTVVYELLKLDCKHKAIISRGGMNDELSTYCNEKSLGSFMESCRELVINGITSIEELVNVTYSYDFK